VPVPAISCTEERVPAIPEIPVIADDRETVRSCKGRDVAYSLLPDDIRDDPDDHYEDEEEDEKNHQLRGAGNT
jgi:hypothetical protein